MNWLGERLLGGLSKLERDRRIDEWAENFAIGFIFLVKMALLATVGYVAVHFIVKFW